MCVQKGGREADAATHGCPPFVTYNFTEGPPGALASQRYRSLCLRASKYSTEEQPCRPGGRAPGLRVAVVGECCM